MVDWSGGLEWWTGVVDWGGGQALKVIKVIFTPSNETHSPIWSCVEPCSLLCSYAVVLVQIINRPSVLVKVYPAYNGFLIP